MDTSFNPIDEVFGRLSRHVLAKCRSSWTIELGFCATHTFFNRQARQVLLEDGFDIQARLLTFFQRELDLGVCWPDSGWGCVHHFYNASTGNGLPGLTGADVYIKRYYSRALELWRQGYCRKAMFFLGAVTHFLQDLCQPYHANCCCGAGHRAYERWVQDNKELYKVTSKGIYKEYSDPVKWLNTCAYKSKELFDLVNEKSNHKYYNQASEYLLPFTQRTTAGFWLNFFQQAGIYDNLPAYKLQLTNTKRVIPFDREKPWRSTTRVKTNEY